jgi:hypothetical protein
MQLTAIGEKFTARLQSTANGIPYRRTRRRRIAVRPGHWFVMSEETVRDKGEIATRSEGHGDLSNNLDGPAKLMSEWMNRGSAAKSYRASRQPLPPFGPIPQVLGDGRRILYFTPGGCRERECIIGCAPVNFLPRRLWLAFVVSIFATFVV